MKTKDGCQVEAISFGRSTSLRLKEAVDGFTDMDEDPKRYLIGYRGGRLPQRRTDSGEENQEEEWSETQ